MEKMNESEMQNALDVITRGRIAQGNSRNMPAISQLSTGEKRYKELTPEQIEAKKKLEDAKNRLTYGGDDEDPFFK